MSAIAVPDFNLLIDDVVQAYVKLIGTAGSGYGMGQPEGAFGSALYLDNAYDRLGASVDPDPTADFGRALRMLRDRMDPETIFADKAKAVINGLDHHFRNRGGGLYSSIETFLAYQNVGAASGDWLALQDYRWSAIFNAVKGGSTVPARYNLFYELTNALTAGGLGSIVIGGSFTAGTAINVAYAGGVPCLLVSSFAGSSSLVTVTGTAYDPATQTTSAGVTWTATVDGNGRFYLAVGSAPAGSLITAVSNIVDTGGNLTASTSIIVEAERPALRSGTVGAGTVTNNTVQLDASASSVNDFYNGLVIKTNADRYTERTISDYDGNTKFATVSVNWATNPTAGASLFRILRPAIS